MKNILRHSGYLAALLACSASLCSGATLCIGPFCVNTAGSRAGIPLLTADPGVRIERPSQGEVPYQSGMALQTGDIIQTTDGHAVIDFDDGNVVALRNHTRIQLGSIKLFLGEVFARISQLVQRGGGQVTTDELSASVRGTEYSVRRTLSPNRTDAGNTAIIVRQGSVLCEDPAKLWANVELTENSIMRVEGTQAPRPPQYVNAAAETGWADDTLKRLLVARESPAPGGTYTPIPRARPPPQAPPKAPPPRPVPRPNY